jgi:hypothetical protein
VVKLVPWYHYDREVVKLFTTPTNVRRVKGIHLITDMVGIYAHGKAGLEHDSATLEHCLPSASYRMKIIYEGHPDSHQVRD